MKWLFDARVWLELFLLFVRPSMAHRIARKPLPAPRHRLTRTDNPFDDFDLLPEHSSGALQIDTATIVMRGGSFDEAQLQELNPPIYLVNWAALVHREGVIYATGDESYVERYAQKGMSPIFYFEGWWTDLVGLDRSAQPLGDLDYAVEISPGQRIAIRYGAPMPKMPPLGSGLACIIALGKIAKHLEIYGWDFYLPAPPREMGSLELLRKLHNPHVESDIYNFHYAHRLSTLPSVTLHGVMGNLGHH